MQITLKKELAEQIGIKELKPFGIDALDSYRYEKGVTIDLAQFSLEKIKNLQKVLSKIPDTKENKINLIQRDIEFWVSMLEDKTPKIRKLEHFKSALVKFLINVDGHRVFMKDENDLWLCFRVTHIRYQEATAYSPQQVVVTFLYEKFNIKNETSKTFHYADVVGKTVSEILANDGIYVETKELREIYLKELEKFKQLAPQIGKQFLVNGIGTDSVLDEKQSWSWSTKEFLFEDHKAVIDIFKEGESRREREEKIDLGDSFWANPFEEEDEYLDSIVKKDELKTEEELNIEIPIHPFLVIFDLQRHMRLSVHVNCLKEYVYDKNLFEKLILPEEIKNLIQMLIEHRGAGFKDIIAGKGGGAIVLLTGSAGVGKTLTAEVYAESEEKPLYSVQASQLGVKPEHLEENLRKVLERATRWNAILLLDEADVYIHKRGNDLHQNAIVGVFLRVLEYHPPVMFMTTNRPDLVDDAIASRCIARIDYEYPTPENQKKIWRVLATVSNIELNDKTIDTFVANHPKVSGRDVKNLLKLANLISKATNEPITFDTVEYVLRFKPTVSEIEKVEKHDN